MMHRSAMAVITVLATALFMVWATPVFAGNTGKVNINTASLEELMTLEGVGKTNAARIVAYREKNGPFKKPDDIVRVKGIGDKTFKINQDRIIVQND